MRDASAPRSHAGAKLVPFVLWPLTGSDILLAIGVLQVLAQDIGTDILPALALGAEPAERAHDARSTSNDRGGRRSPAAATDPRAGRGWGPR